MKNIIEKLKNALCIGLLTLGAATPLILLGGAGYYAYRDFKEIKEEEINPNTRWYIINEINEPIYRYAREKWDINRIMAFQAMSPAREDSPGHLRNYIIVRSKERLKKVYNLNPETQRALTVKEVNEFFNDKNRSGLAR